MSATATPDDVIAGRARWCVVHGDSAEVLPSIAASSVAAVVTDPPSGIAFMGAEWDKNKGGRAQWVAWLANILGLARVATKPGGRTFVWSLPRTSHWTGCAVEDAGWNIETTVSHLFGCLTPDTEILVNGEWVSYDKATAGSLAMCYDSERDSLAWKPIGELVVYEHHQQLYRLRGDLTDQLVTRGHRCPVYRNGRVVFVPADEVAEGGTALVPVVEDLQGLLASLPLPQRAGGSLESVRSGMPYDAAALAKDEAAPGVSDVRRGIHPEEQPRSPQGEALLNVMQRASSSGDAGLRGDDGDCRGAGEVRVDGGISRVVPREDDRSEQSRVARRRDARVIEGELHARGVRALPDGVPSDGSARRVDSGAPAHRGGDARPDAHDSGERASRQPQPARQSNREPDALRVELGPQEVRASRFARADLVRVTAEHHRGVVWCVTVSTGAFVARRNGKVFITGNTGWPKGATQLKPAAETWWLARNGQSTPLEIDACRVAASGKARSSVYSGAKGAAQAEFGAGTVLGNSGKYLSEPHDAGRWPPNAVFSHTPSCVREGVRKVTGNTQGDTRGALGYGGGVAQPRGAIYTDPDGHETVDAWTCADGCPVAELAMQSGEGSSGGVRGGETRVDAMPIGWHGREQREHTTHGDTGTAARFFPQFPADDPSEPFNAPLFRYEAKPSRAEKNAGCDELDEAIVERCSAMAQGPLPQQTPREATPQGNHHATVKGVALMAWLIRLITKPGDVVLDPFGGSGTTAVAALLEGRRVILIERDPRYVEIARARCEHAAPSPERLRTMTSTPIRVAAPEWGALFDLAKAPTP